MPNYKPFLPIGRMIYYVLWPIGVFSLISQSFLTLLPLLLASLILLHALIYQLEERLSYKWDLVFHTVIKISLIFSSPLLSNDVYRYLFNAELLKMGIFPASISPIHAQEVLPNFSYYSWINHPELSSIYLPMSDLFFVLPSILNPTVEFTKLAYLLMEFFVLFFCYNQGYLNRKIAFLILCHPLLIIETYSSGHFEIIFLYSLMLFFLTKIRIFLFINFGIRIHHYLFEIFFKKISWTHFWVLLILLSYLLPALQDKSGLSQYYQHFYFNHFLFTFLYKYIYFLSEAIEFIMPYTAFIKILNAFILAVPFYFFIKKFKTEQSQILIFYIGCIWMSSVIHPWYFIVTLFSLSQRIFWTVHLMISISMLSYYVKIKELRTGLWEENTFISALLFLSLIVFFIELYNKKEEILQND